MSLLLGGGRNRLAILGVLLTLAGGYALYRSIAHDDTSESHSCRNNRGQPATCKGFDKESERSIGVIALPVGVLLLLVTGAGIVQQRRRRAPGP